jgi:hypothetical protein
MACRRFWTSWLAIPVASLTFSSPSQAQTARFGGTVHTSTERPLPEVELTIQDLDRSVLTDSAGRFTFGTLPSGSYVVRVRRIGFQAQQFALVLEAGSTRDVRIVLEPGTYELPDVNVVVRELKPIEYAYTHRYDDFFRYRRLGLGYFKTRAQFKNLNPLRTADILSGLPGIRIRHRAWEHPMVWITGCQRLGVYIDGNLQRPVAPDGTSGEFLDRVLPSQIEMVALFRGPAEMPAEAAQSVQNDCAIMIWTR